MINLENILNEYAENKDSGTLLERAENLAKALVITKDNYGFAPTASSYAKFEKEDKLPISKTSAKKDIIDVARQIDQKKLDNIRDRRLDFKNVKDGFEKRFSKTKSFGAEVEDFSNTVFNIANKKNEYEKPIEKAVKKLEVKEADPVEIQNEIKKILVNTIVPMLQIEVNKQEADDGISLLKAATGKSKSSSLIIRKSNPLEKGYLTNQLKKKIETILLNEGIKTKSSSTSWSKFIFDIVSNNFSALEKNIDQIKNELYSTITSATKRKGDILVSYNDKKINIEVKNSAKGASTNYIEMLIVFTHDKKGVLPLVRLAKSLSIDDQSIVDLWTSRYNNFVNKLGEKKDLTVSPCYVMGSKEIYKFTKLIVSSSGKDFRYIKVKTNLGEPMSLSAFVSGVLNDTI